MSTRFSSTGRQASLDLELAPADRSSTANPIHEEVPTRPPGARAARSFPDRTVPIDSPILFTDLQLFVYGSADAHMIVADRQS